MTIYPEIESWDEFYPIEIFVSYTASDNIDELLKNAPVGSTIYLGENAESTAIFKKVAKAKGSEDLTNSFVLLGVVSQKG